MPADQFIRTIEIKDKTGRVVGTKEVVTYQGLLSKAHDEGLKRVTTSLLQIPAPDNAETAIAKAVVETEKGIFEGIGDANAGNVNSFIVPHLIRMAETRAKARALRDAVNVGVVSFEELVGE
jgi:translation initiation factor 6 (eIF-6)